MAHTPPADFLRHRKVGTIRTPAEYGVLYELPDDDPRRRVLELTEPREIAHYKLPKVYFNEVTDSSVKLLPIKPELINNKPANDNFQESLLACLLNLSPFLNLLDMTARKHAILGTMTQSHLRKLLDLRHIFWDEQVYDPRYDETLGGIETLETSESWYDEAGTVADGLSKALFQPQTWRTEDKTTQDFLRRLFDARKSEESTNNQGNKGKVFNGTVNRRNVSGFVSSWLPGDDSPFPITEIPGTSWADLQ